MLPCDDLAFFLDSGKTAELIALAEEQGVPARSWAQLFTDPDNIPGPDARTMREASSLLGYLVQGSKDGNEKSVG